MTYNFSHFPILDGKEIDCVLQRVIVNHLSFLHDNIQTIFEDLLQMNIPLFVNFLHTMTMKDVVDQSECVQIEMCDVFGSIGSKRGYKAQSNIESCIKKWNHS